jgi:ADP-heptose:LPS heptosyltransferase
MSDYTYVPKLEKSIVEFKSNPKSDKNLIWIVEGGLGKNIAATALCQTIKETYPDRRLIMVVSYPEVFLNNPFIDRVYFAGNRPYFYEDYIKDKDVLIFKHEPYHQTDHILRKKHLIENWCDLLSIPYTNQQPQVFVNMAQKMTQSIWLREKPTMVLQTNGGPLTGQKYGYSWCRDIPYEIGQSIVDKYKDQYHIFQITRPDSQKLAGVEVIDQPLTNMELFAVLVGAQKRVLIDSSLQHAAAAFNLPSTVFWVGTSPTVFGYKLHNNIVAKEPKGGTKLIDAYIFDYNLDGVLHECPYIDVNEMFDKNVINKI